jgi:PST family polysaccharide transporter
VSNYFAENRQAPDHARKSLRGGAISISARGFNAVVQIGSVLFLARLLTPEDYGLVSMVAALTGFAPLLVDLGTRDAMVQRPQITEGEASALFWISTGIGGALSILIAGSASFIAAFYGEPRLAGIAAVSSLTFISASLTVQHQALLRRTMQFQKLAASETAANVLSAVAVIALALRGFGYWALVLKPILMNLLLAIGVWIQTGWWPRRPTMTSGVTEMLRFGLHLTGFTMTDFVRRSADRVAIGLRSGAVALGYYQNALFVYDNLIDILVFPLHSVAVASLSKLRHDLPELKRLWSKALSTLAFFLMPAFGILAVTSQDVIVLVLGAKWAPAGVVLGILALRGIPNGMERTLGWLHVAAGRSDRWMRWGIFAMFVQFVALFAGLPWGPVGVATAYAISIYVLFVPALAYAGKPLEIGALDVVRALWRPLAGSLIAVALSYVFRVTLLAATAPWTRTAVLVAVYVAIYSIIVAGILRLHTPLRVTWSLARDFLPSRLIGRREFRLGAGG